MFSVGVWSVSQLRGPFNCSMVATEPGSIWRAVWSERVIVILSLARATAATEKAEPSERVRRYNRVGAGGWGEELKRTPVTLVQGRVVVASPARRVTPRAQTLETTPWAVSPLESWTTSSARESARFAGKSWPRTTAATRSRGTAN